MAFVGAWVQAQGWMRNAFKQLNSYLMASQSCSYLCEILLCVVFLLNFTGPGFRLGLGPASSEAFLSIPRLNAPTSTAPAIPSAEGTKLQGSFRSLGRSQIFSVLRNGAGSNN